MIREIFIKNFRSFRNLEIKDLGQINIVVGRNNTGKSSFLEATYLGISGYPIFDRNKFSYILKKRNFQLQNFYHHHYFTKVEVREIPYFIRKFLDKMDMSAFDEYLKSFIFYSNSSNGRIELKIENKKVRTTLEYSKPHLQTILETLLDAVDQKFLLKFSDLIGKRIIIRKQFPLILLNKSPVLELQIYMRLYSRHISNRVSLFIESSLIFNDFGLHYKEEKIKHPSLFIDSCMLCNSDYLKYLKKLEKYTDEQFYDKNKLPYFYFKVPEIKKILSAYFDKKIDYIEPGFQDFYINLSDGTRIPLSMVGDGIRSFILHYMALGISPERKAYLFFEEPENYLHPGLMSALARAMVETPHQVFAATHNLDFLKRVLYYAKERRKDIRVLAFRDLKDGIPEIKIYDLDEAFTALNVLEMDLR